jgi:hypothetical protein
MIRRCSRLDMRMVSQKSPGCLQVQLMPIKELWVKDPDGGGGGGFGFSDFGFGRTAS